MSISSSKPFGRKRSAALKPPAKPRDARGPSAKQHRPDPAYVRELIAQAGLTHVQLAQRMGCTTRTIERWVSPRGRIPYAEQFLLEAIARANAPRPAKPKPVVPKPAEPAPQPVLRNPLAAVLALRNRR